MKSSERSPLDISLQSETRILALAHSEQLAWQTASLLTEDRLFVRC